MPRKIRRAVIYILWCILFCVSALDVLLWQLDPLGLVRWHYTFRAQHEVMQSHPTGFAYSTGAHWFHAYSATILPDGSRLVPDTNTQADCAIVFIGDSVTYGQGVNDADTWINLLARRFPDVHFINAGRSAYSAGNVLLTKHYYAGDGYVWMLVGNDAEPAFFYDSSRPSAHRPSATRLHYDWLFRNPVVESGSLDMEFYWQAVEQIADNRTLILGTDNDPLTRETATRYPVQIVQGWIHDISHVDGHANAHGNVEIANSVLPFVEPFITRICHGE